MKVERKDKSNTLVENLKVMLERADLQKFAEKNKTTVSPVSKTACDNIDLLNHQLLKMA